MCLFIDIWVLFNTRCSQEPESLTWLPKRNSMPSLAEHCGKKWWLRKQFLRYRHDRHIKLPQELISHWNPTKLIFRDMAAILKKKWRLGKVFDSTIIFATPHTTYSSWNDLSSYYTFWDIKYKSWKIRKNNLKRAITPTLFHGSSRKSHSR